MTKRELRSDRPTVGSPGRLATNGVTERHAGPHRLDQGDAEDHQGDADGRGLEAAPRAERRGSGAALCAAHGRGDRQHRRRGRRLATARRRCWPAPAGIRCICCWSAPANAACRGAFNASIVRLARERALALMAQGKTVKFFCVGRKGYEQLRRNFEKQIIEHVELRSRAPARLRAMPRTSPSRSSRGSTPASSTSARCSIRASSR